MSTVVQREILCKREIIATPFAAQIDDIDKALFDYRYKKQSQQHSNNKFANAGYQRFSNNARSVSNHQHYQNYHSHNQHAGYQGHFVTAAANAPVCGNAHCMTSNNLSSGSGVAVGSNNVLQAPQPSKFQEIHFPVSSASTAPYSAVSSKFSSVVAASPDSFVEELVSEKFEPFAQYKKLSSSVSSETSASTTSTALHDSELKNMNVYNGVNKNGVFHSNIIDGNCFNVNDNGFNNSVSVLNNNSTYDSNHIRSGWLNIWGNDMSVWS